MYTVEIKDGKILRESHHHNLFDQRFYRFSRLLRISRETIKTTDPCIPMATVRRLGGTAPGGLKLRCTSADKRGRKKTLFFVKTNTMRFAVIRSVFNKKKKNRRRGSFSPTNKCVHPRNEYTVTRECIRARRVSSTTAHRSISIIITRTLSVKRHGGQRHF